MKKIVYLLLALVLFGGVLSACATRPLENDSLLEDLNAYGVDLVEIKNVEFTELDVEKRKTDDKEGTDDVYVWVCGESEELSCKAAYRLMYVMYNDGWRLEEVQLHNYENWEIIPRKGVSQDVLGQIVAENYEFSAIEPSITNEKLEEGKASYSYIITKEYNYSTQYDTVRIDCQMNPYTHEWDFEHSVIAQNEEWDVAGTWYLEANSMISGMDATVVVDEMNTLEFVGSYHMEREDFFTDEIEDIWDETDVTRLLELDKLADRPTLKIGDAKYDPGYQIGVTFDREKGLLFTYYGDTWVAYMTPMTKVA